MYPDFSKATLRAFLQVLLISVTVLFMTVTSAQAVPGVAWIRSYDTGGTDSFWDVYYAANGDFVACGAANNHGWITRIDSDGEQIWSTQCGSNNAGTLLFAVIETDSGDFVAVGTANENPYAVMVTAAGEVVWERTEQFQGSSTACIELKAGSFIISAFRATVAYLYSLTYEGESNWARQWSDQRQHRLYALRETDDGVVSAGFIFDADWPDEDPLWILKTDFNGRQVWSQEHYPQRRQEGWAMCSIPGGFAIAGRFYEHNVNSSDAGMFFINQEGALTGSRRIDINRENYPEKFYGVVRLAGGRVAAVGGGPLPHMAMFRRDGTVAWTRRFDELAAGNQINITAQVFQSVVVTSNNELIAASTARCGREAVMNGILMKLEPMTLNLTILGYTPEDTVFSCLPGDSVNFIVRAKFEEQDSIRIEWLRNDESIGRDTIQTVVFDQQREEIIECRISVEEQALSIRWHVSVTPLYIASYRPDLLNLQIRRGTQQAFSIDARRLPELDPSYLWTLASPDGAREEVSEETNASPSFRETGRYQLEAFAYAGDANDAVNWEIDVASVLRSFVPIDERIVAEVDSMLQFQLYPTNPESDSISYQWSIDGGMPYRNQSFNVSFQSEGERIIKGWMADGVAADSVEWRVSIVPPNGINLRGPLAPTELSLNISPNPFNSATTIHFSLSAHSALSAVNLRIYGLDGRFVEELWTSRDAYPTEERQAGRLSYAEERPINRAEQVTWNAEGLPGGVYIVRLEAGKDIRTMKAILLR